MSSQHQVLHSELHLYLLIEVIELTVEQDIAELKTDIKWIKKSIEDLREERQLNIGYLIGLIGSVIIAIASLGVAIFR